jgi:dTDP-glucose 4,6-dehydratase
MCLVHVAWMFIDLTESRSVLVLEALPFDDPQVRQPDITRARQLLSWEPEVELEQGLRRMLPSFGREPVVA